jgi:signal transduction histidine kinase
VDRSRRLKLGVTAAVFVLLLLTTMALVRFTRRAQRLAGLQMEFVAGVSHELRTPLSVVRTAAHNLAEGVIRDADEMRSYGVLIEEEIGRLTTTVEQVLRFSRLESVQSVTPREPVEVNSMIERAIAGSSEVLKDAGMILERNVEAHLPPVPGDAAALQQALQNLIENAVKYGRDGGWMEVRALMCKMSDGCGIEIAVKDRGRGLSAADLEMAFVPFFRGARAIADQIHGTGLGLSLVKRTIEGHGGSVIAVSEPGSGAEFIMRIPVAPVRT